jgi:hypothetical protein
LFRRGARDETFSPEMGVISMLVKLDGWLEGADLSVMAGLPPGHPSVLYPTVARTWTPGTKAGHDDASR